MSATALPAVTIVVPTIDEAGNIYPLVLGIKKALEGRPTTVLVVDDSHDTTTAEAVAVTAQELATPGFTVGVYHRTNGSAWGGLGGAVTDGLRRTTTPLAVVMDADLQHPPEVLPALLARLDCRDLVIASRYCNGGSADGLHSPLRQVVSRGSTLAAKLVFPGALRGVTDPMSGFFALRVKAVDAEALEPNGFKILLETIVTNPRLNVGEVPFHFADRHNGTSKGTLIQGVHYLVQLASLRSSLWLRTLHSSTQ